MITVTANEVADRLGVSYGTARRKLRELLEEGLAEKVGRQDSNGERGRPADIYKVKNRGARNLGLDVE